MVRSSACLALGVSEEVLKHRRERQGFCGLGSGDGVSAMQRWGFGNVGQTLRQDTEGSGALAAGKQGVGRRLQGVGRRVLGVTVVITEQIHLL